MGLATRLVGELGDELSQLSLSGPRTNAAVRTMLSGVLSLLVALRLNLDDPWWAAITGFSIVQQNAAATLLRSIDRALGTIVGALIGYFAAGLVADHLVFQLICGGCAAFGIDQCTGGMVCRQQPAKSGGCDWFRFLPIHDYSG